MQGGRRQTFKQKLDTTLSSLRYENEQKMKQKLSKKKIEIVGRYDKQQVHNILNSLLQGQVIDQDLFNQFWSHFFKDSAAMIDIIHTYNNAVIMLLDKLLKTENRIFELNKEKQRLKQSHDYKSVNMVNVDLQNLYSDKERYEGDLNEFSKPFQFNYIQNITDLKAQYIRMAKTMAQSPKKAEQEVSKTFSNAKVQGVIFNLLGDTIQEEQVAEQPQLTTQEKYYRFIVYISVIMLIIQMSIIYNQPNFFGLIFSCLLAFNSLLQDYFLVDDQSNLFMNKLLVSIHDQNLYVKNTVTFQTKRWGQHNFSNYAASIFLFLSIAVVWDILWMILIGPAYLCNGSNSHIIEGMGTAMSRYNTYIYYAQLFILFTKIIIIFFSSQIIKQVQFQRIFNPVNLWVLFLRLCSKQFLKDNVLLELKGASNQ